MFFIEESVTDSTGSSDQYFIARKVIKIGSLIYRKLNKEKQFLYTLVQDHSIWSNEQFWIEHFFHQHQRRLVAHYQRQATDKSPSKTEESFHGPENAHHGDGDLENFLVCSEMMDNTEVRIEIIPYDSYAIGWANIEPVGFLETKSGKYREMSIEWILFPAIALGNGSKVLPLSVKASAFC